MKIIKKIKKLQRDPRGFMIDYFDKRSSKSSSARKLRKLFKDPVLYFSDFIQKRSFLQKNLEKYSDAVPLDQYHFQLYSKYKSLNYNARAEAALLTAIKLKKTPEYYHALGLRLKQKKQWWQAADAYASATELADEIKPSWHKEYAFILTRMNRHADAARAWKHALSHGSKNANDWFAYGYALVLSSQKEASDYAFERATEFDKDKNSKGLGIGIFYEKIGHWKPASIAYTKQLQFDPLDADVHYKLGLALDRCYQWEDAENAFLAAISLAPKNIQSHYRLGFVRERQGKYVLAAEAYAHAVEHRKAHTPYWYYRLGYVLNKAGQYQESCAAFLMMKKIVLENAPADNDQVDNAASEYAQVDNAPADVVSVALSILPVEEKKLENKMSLVDLLEYLLDDMITKTDIIDLLKNDYGKTENDTNLWKVFFSEHGYKEKVFECIVEDFKKSEQEMEKARQEAEKATQAAEKAAREENKKAEKAERQAEKLQLEIKLIETALASNSTRSNLWYKLAKSFEQLNDLEKAITAYKNLIARKEHFDGNLYFSMGHLLARQEKYEEAVEAFLEQRVMQDAHGLTENPYNKDAVLKKIINYVAYYERFSLDEKTILYESYQGSAITGSPYAIFKYLLSDKRFNDYTHVWVVNDKNKIPESLIHHENIVFISKSCDGYMRYLSKAKYLINNTTFPDWYIRKDQQVYLNTWHGTPIKTLGTDVAGDFMAHKNQTRNFLQASHVVSPNQYTTEILMNSYGFGDVFTGVMATTGYPRQDLFLNISGKEKASILRAVNVSGSQKVVLYAPTWRGGVGEAVIDTKQLRRDVKKLQEIEGVQILFRGHYMVEKILSQTNLNVTVVPESIDTNSLLSIVDVLITDYSSICFDFMALGRPIIYYVYDREAYEKERGLYFPLEELGGEICYTNDELKSSLQKVIKTPHITSTQQDAQNKFCAYDNGEATSRVVDLIFFNKIKGIAVQGNTKKKSILLYGGPLMANGITTSFVNLANHIDKSKYSVTIVIDPGAIASDELRMEQFEKFDDEINVIPRVGRMLMSLEERNALGQFNTDNNLACQELWDLHEASHQREFKRVFGYGKFDYVINFEGYTAFWATLMGMGNDTTHSNSIYQHNDLFEEWRMKFPYLEQTFELYRFYDHITSVSEMTKEHNCKRIVEYFGAEKEKFIHCDNVQDPETIISRSEENVFSPHESRMFENKKVFLNIGRLSPEKGHEKLIRAFYEVSKEYPEARLVNLGHGVLKDEINHLIKDLKLQNKVFFVGQKSNPYPYLKASSCFVLSSDHEGQPMTLFEAMILKKPLIATDIVGNRGVLEGRPGHLIENSIDGLIYGMKIFLEGEYDHDGEFDYKQYNQNALNMVYEKLLTSSTA